MLEVFCNGSAVSGIGSLIQLDSKSVVTLSGKEVKGTNKEVKRTLNVHGVMWK